MEPADIDRGLELCRAANWNQVRADWDNFLARAACFAAVIEDQVVGTCVVLDPGGPAAWIAMMLVDPAVRRQSIGKLLFDHTLGQTQAKSVGLDATDAGKPLYTKFGFVPSAQITRWYRNPGLTIAPSLLSRCQWRDGYISNHIGPIFANNANEATDQVLSCLAAKPESSWILDVPSNLDSSWLKELGFATQRIFTRMYRGPAEPIPSNLYATSGPEYGNCAPREL